VKDNLKYVDILCAGNEVGLKYFIAHLGEPLHFFAFKITKNKEASEEIVSEAFCKLWQRRDKITSYENIKSFLYLVTRNACYDHMGSAYQKKVSLSHDDWTSIESKDDDMLGQIIYVELIMQVVEELEKLPKQQADVFRLSYLEGMDTKEICDLLGTSASTVYFARSKAISTLRMIFKEKDINIYTTLLLFTWLY